MHIPLIVAVLALLAFVLLPLLDRPTSSEIDAKGLQAHLVRIKRWVNE